MWGGEQNSMVLTSQHVTPRGTTQGDGIDHTPMKLRYYWGPVSTSYFIHHLKVTTICQELLCFLDYLNQSWQFNLSYVIVCRL